MIAEQSDRTDKLPMWTESACKDPTCVRPAAPYSNATLHVLPSRYTEEENVGLNVLLKNSFLAPMEYIFQTQPMLQRVTRILGW